jgi:hypothetical protein
MRNAGHSGDRFLRPSVICTDEARQHLVDEATVVTTTLTRLRYAACSQAGAATWGARGFSTIGRLIAANNDDLKRAIATYNTVAKR